MRIDLLRHGVTVGGMRFLGSTDVPLSEHGWRRMWSAVARHAQPWHRIVASPLVRCADFARALAQQRGLPCILDARIREIDFGAWEGRSAAEILAADGPALTRFWSDPVTYPPPGAEPLAGFAARVMSAWHDAVANPATDRLVWVTHGGVARVILGHILDRPLERLLEFEVGHAALLSIRVEARAGGYRYALEGGWP